MLYISTYSTPSADRRERGRSTREMKRKTEHSRGRALLDFALQKEYGLDLDNLTLEQADNGKPYIREYPDIHFNISHTDGMVACAVHEDEVGVDVELIRPYSGRVAKRALADDEYCTLARCEERGQSYGSSCFFRYWTLKESYVKATGEGLAVPFSSLTFSWDEEEKIKSNKKGYKFYQSCLWNQYMLSVCIKKSNRSAIQDTGGQMRKERNSMTYEALFKEIKTIFGKADVSGIKEHLAYEFVVEGEGEGTFYAEVSDGKLDVEPYDYHDCDARFISSADTLLKIAKGKADPVAAFTLGKLKVEGSIDRALMIQQFIKK